MLVSKVINNRGYVKLYSSLRLMLCGLFFSRLPLPQNDRVATRVRTEFNFQWDSHQLIKHSNTCNTKKRNTSLNPSNLRLCHNLQILQCIVSGICLCFIGRRASALASSFLRNKFNLNIFDWINYFLYYTATGRVDSWTKHWNRPATVFSSMWPYFISNCCSVAISCKNCM